ncbi:Uncharacterized protein dnm_070760 [Desulfonema magnum]|uniref:Uncharacterized protein n=1 Tax=Desulfonema magnum TaxID=45655 RepID=A0A975BSP4_9BACT|nr:Uncharacterized protein dnm_070760 [Desulfonema magnum]
MGISVVMPVAHEITHIDIRTVLLCGFQKPVESLEIALIPPGMTMRSGKS